MSSIIFFLIFIPILSIVLLSVNFIFAPHNPYKEKKTPFECGYHSFLSQNRSQFTISFFIFALLFLLFDLEIVLIYPYTVSSYANNIYGLIVMIVFTLIVTVGFIFELGKNALKIESKQDNIYKKNNKQKIPLPHMFVSKSLDSGLFGQKKLITYCIISIILIIIGFSNKYHIKYISDQLDMKEIYTLCCILFIIPLDIIASNLRGKDYKFNFLKFIISASVIILVTFIIYDDYSSEILNCFVLSISSYLPSAVGKDLAFKLKDLLPLKIKADIGVTGITETNSNKAIASYMQATGGTANTDSTPVLFVYDTARNIFVPKPFAEIQALLGRRWEPGMVNMYNPNLMNGRDIEQLIRELDRKYLAYISINPGKIPSFKDLQLVGATFRIERSTFITFMVLEHNEGFGGTRVKITNKRLNAVIIDSEILRKLRNSRFLSR